MARLIANTANMPVDEWLELRKQGIGGSDASAVVGVNKYANPVTLYMEKLSYYNRNAKDNVREAAEWGNRLEPVVRETFKEKINAERAEQGLSPLRIVHRKAIYAHDEHDFIRTNLDGIIYGHELGTGIFEAKTAHYMLREDWEGEDVPNQYFIQVQHNMLVMGAKYAYLAVLIGGNTYKHYFIQRDEEICEMLISMESDFWHNHILKRIPPANNGHAAEKEMIKDMNPHSEHVEGYLKALPNVCIEYVEKIEALKDILEDVEQEKTMYENEVKMIMGNTELAFAGSHKVTWKTASNGVRPLRITLDAALDKEKYYKPKFKEFEQTKKDLDKEIEVVAKAKLKADKAATKARKELEANELKAIKAKEKALKQAEKERIAAEKAEEKLRKAAEKAGEPYVPPVPNVVDREHVLDLFNDLHDDVQAMRESGDTDLRTVLHQIQNKVAEVLK